MKNTKVLIIYPSQLYAPEWGRVNTVKPHLVALFSYLYGRVAQVRVLDLECELGRPRTNLEVRQFQEKASRLIGAVDFDLAAISCYTSINYLGSIMAGQLCKKINPGCRVAVGGYHPSSLPADFMYKNSPFDFIVRGEGELALAGICASKKSLNSRAQFIQGVPLNLKDGPALKWNEYKYVDPHRHHQLYLSRGCPFTCAFCSEFCKGPARWRAYPVSRAIAEIKRLIASRDPRKIGIADACFGFNPEWRREFLLRLVKMKLDKILGFECRVDMLKKEDIDLLGRLNSNVIFGLESGSAALLAIMRKSSNPRRYLKACRETLRYMNNKGVPYKIYLVFNHPGETLATYTETIAFLRSIVEENDTVSGYIVAQNYSFFPGSRIFERFKEYRRRYGTSVAHPQWWKQTGEHSRLARQVVASKGFQLAAKGKFWEKDILDLNQRIFAKMPANIKTFWWEVYRKD